MYEVHGSLNQDFTTLKRVEYIHIQLFQSYLYLALCHQLHWRLFILIPVQGLKKI